MEKDCNEKARGFLQQALRQVLVEIDDDISVPLLNRNTQQIVINCHGGSVVDFKPLLKFK
jgi:hypothetical protein